MSETLINDLLDLAKLENDKLSLDEEFFNFNDTLFNAMRMLEFSARQHGVKMKAIIDQPQNLDLLSCLYGDQRRYTQILINFLSNALKFTNKNGCVTVKISFVGIQKATSNNERKIKSLKINFIGV